MTTATSQPWVIHTDGSALSNPGPAGWAILVEQPDGNRWSRSGSARKSTNNRAEMKAVTEALKAIPLDGEATIISDSKYVLQGAKEWRRAWEARGMRTAAGRPVVNEDLWRKLWSELDARPKVVLQWTRGHAGTAGNERVDTLARSAAEKVKAGGAPIKAATSAIEIA